MCLNTTISYINSYKKKCNFKEKIFYKTYESSLYSNFLQYFYRVGNPKINNKNYIHSNRKSVKLTKSEIFSNNIRGEIPVSINKGIHVYRNKPEFLLNISRFSASIICIPVICNSKYLIAINDDEAVFTKIKISNKTLLYLKKHGLYFKKAK